MLRAISKAAIAAIIVIIVIIVAAGLYLAVQTQQPAPQAKPAKPTETGVAEQPEKKEAEVAQPAEKKLTIRLAVLLPLSGDLESYGRRSRAAAELAIEDFEKEYGVKVDYTVEDTRTDPAEARRKLEILFGQGYRYVVGPMTSAAVSELLNYAINNKIIVISPSSTAPSLAVEKPYVFRFVPTDVFQSKAIAAYIKQLGAECVVVVYREDDWGKGLAEGVMREVEALGIKVGGMVPYDPKTQDFTPVIDDVRRAVEACGTDKTIINLIAFEEAAQILQLAAENAPELLNYKWVGSDGTAQSKKIATDACDAVSRVGLDSTVFAPPETDVAKRFRERFREKVGEDPDAYSYVTYDAVRVLLEAIYMAAKEGKADDPDTVRRYIYEVLKEYEGVTGVIKLDEYNDRASGNYDVYSVVKEDGKCEWVKVAYIDTAETPPKVYTVS